MTAKEAIAEAVAQLEDSTSLSHAEAMERIDFLVKLKRGLEQDLAGELIPHEEVRQRMAKWLK